MSDEKEFNELLADKRHKELILALENVVRTISDTKGLEVSKVIERESVTLRSIIDSLKVPIPEVKIEHNSDELVAVCTELLEVMAEVKDALQNRPTWEFTVSRDTDGLIETITAKPNK